MCHTPQLRLCVMTLLIGTRKGIFLLDGDADGSAWSLSEPQFLGHVAQHVVADPRAPGTVLAAMRTGHLGPTVFRSSDGGATWKEASSPPAFHAGERLARSVSKVFWLTPGHADQPGVWYVGASPQGLFVTHDGGDTWAPVDGWNDHPMWETWAEWPEQQTPDGSMLHSVIVDPRDADAPLHRALGRRRVRVHRRRRRLGAAQRRVPGRLLPRPVPGVRAGPALRAHAPHHARPAVPAEPLRHLPHRPTGERLGAHRRQHAARGRRHRVPDRAAPPRPRPGVGVPDGRHRRVATHQPRRPPGRVRHRATPASRGSVATPACPSGPGSR